MPKTIPRTTETGKSIPYAILPADSAVLKVMVFLAVQGHVAVEFTPDTEMARVVLFPLLTGTGMEHLSPIVPKYLPREFARRMANCSGTGVIARSMLPSSVP